MRRFAPLTLLALAACSPEPASETRGDPELAASAPAESRSSAPVQAPAGDAQAVLGAPAGSAQQPTLAVEGEGLRWFLPPNGSARPLAFGTAQADVLASVERVRGLADRGTNEDCGAGRVQYASWPDGLSLVFQDGRFVGWGLDRRAAGALATADGVGPGMTRGELAGLFGSVRFSQTSLGTEFAAGEMFGVLDGSGPAARITDLWAGVNCIAR